LFSTKGNVRVLELNHRCHISSHDQAGGSGQGCGFQICFHLLKKLLAFFQISPASAFALFTYKEGKESQASLTQ